MALIRVWFLTLCLFLLAACGGDAGLEATRISEHATLSNDAAFQRETATYAADRVRVTVEFLETRVRSEEDRRLYILRTLEGLGIDTFSAGLITPEITAVSPQELESQAMNFGVVGGITRSAPTPQAPFQPPTATIDPILAQPTTDPNAPHLSNVSISSGVGTNDCATQPASQFVPNTQELYAVGTANNFAAGTSITFTWLFNGQVIYTDSFSWQHAIHDVCIWYYVTPEDFPFTPGTYTVRIESDGQPLAAPLTYTITDTP